jgi:hypothetical protein
MPGKTDDIEFAIEMAVKPGEEITLPELDRRLYASYPALADIDRRWIWAALCRMIQDGRLVTANPDAAFSDTTTVRRQS